MQVQRNSRELWLSFIAILFMTILYLLLITWNKAIPEAEGFWGHGIGILGFLLMLMTETLYSLRKRSRSARWGRMSNWLEFHIFTGIVGPYMVLLHSAWKFNGLAGIVTLLMVIIVVSGFIGRYIYTAVPRTVDGAELEAQEIQSQINILDMQYSEWAKQVSDAGLHAYINKMGAPAKPVGNSILEFFSYGMTEWIAGIRVWYAKSKLDSGVRTQLEKHEYLIQRRRQLARQIHSLAVARKLLAFWHAIHVPIGMALFTAAFVHIIAALYYATLMR